MIRGRWRVAALVAGASALVACADSGQSDSTLGPLGSAGPSTVASAVASPPSSPGSTLPAGQPGAGFVSMQVRLAASGVDETLTLDRATVPADQLDPISLDAFCTPLDGGDGLTVSVTDLRRLSAGERLVSAMLVIDSDVAAPGTFPGRLEVGDAQQTVTRYEGPVSVDEGMWSGTFDLRDAAGNAATGSFVCAPEAVEPTTVPASQVPVSIVGGGATVPTAPPLPTVPEATS